MIANDYTDLRERPKRWWIWRFIVFDLPALSAAAATFVGCTVSAGLIAGLTGARALAGWGTLAALVLTVAVYGVWGKARPDGMRFGSWLFAFYDYRVRQPHRFYGLRTDTEPSRLKWAVIVFDPTNGS